MYKFAKRGKIAKRTYIPIDYRYSYPLSYVVIAYVRVTGKVKLVVGHWLISTRLRSRGTLSFYDFYGIPRQSSFFYGVERDDGRVEYQRAPLWNIRKEKRLATGALNELYIYIYIYIYTREAFLRSFSPGLFDRPPSARPVHTYGAYIRTYAHTTLLVQESRMLKGRRTLSHNTQQRCIIRFRVQQLLNDWLHGPIGGPPLLPERRRPLLDDPFHL